MLDSIDITESLVRLHFKAVPGFHGDHQGLLSDAVDLRKLRLCSGIQELLELPGLTLSGALIVVPADK